MTITTKKEAKAEIDRLTKQANDALTQAEKIADEWYITFGFNPAYGMGGSYYPVHRENSKWSIPTTDDEREAFENEHGDEYYFPGYDEDERGWYSSSQSC